MKFFQLLFGLLFPVFSMFAQEWPSVPNEARPGTRWWWMGSAVDENNLTTNMKEYACAGRPSTEYREMKPAIYLTYRPDGWKCYGLHRRKANGMTCR